jgi:hypothetical protein
MNNKYRGKIQIFLSLPAKDIKREMAQNLDNSQGQIRQIWLF